DGRRTFRRRDEEAGADLRGHSRREEAVVVGRARQVAVGADQVARRLAGIQGQVRGGCRHGDQVRERPPDREAQPPRAHGRYCSETGSSRTACTVRSVASTFRRTSRMRSSSLVSVTFLTVTSATTKAALLGATGAAVVVTRATSASGSVPTVIVFGAAVAEVFWVACSRKLLWSTPFRASRRRSSSLASVTFLTVTSETTNAALPFTTGLTLVSIARMSATRGVATAGAGAVVPAVCAAMWRAVRMATAATKPPVAVRHALPPGPIMLGLLPCVPLLGEGSLARARRRDTSRDSRHGDNADLPDAGLRRSDDRIGENQRRRVGVSDP